MFVAVALLGGCSDFEGESPTTEPSWRDGEVVREPIPQRPLVAPPPGAPVRLVIKTVDAVRGRLDGNALVSHAGASLDRLAELQDEHDLVFSPAIDLDPARVEALLERALLRSGRPQPDLLGVHAVSLPDDDPEGLVTVARALSELPSVEYVTLETLRVAPPFDVEPATPALDGAQGYAFADTGIDAAAAHELGYDGTGIRIADLEYNWLLGHEEWNETPIATEPGQTPDAVALEGLSDGNHGLAVLGELVAPDNGYGVTGLAPGSHAAVYPTLTVESGSRRAAAIASAAADSAAGDIVLLEMQTPATPGDDDYGPAELDESVWMATKVATDAGVIVVAAAGNGSVDLDGPALASYRNRGDSGALMVGAGDPVTRNTLGFSTFGSRVNVQGWGSSVVTTGYGTLATYGGDTNQSYSNSFSGTSSASPIVAGAAALVQQAAKEEAGVPLSPMELREVLQLTGLPQGLGGNVGPLPQAPAAIVAAQTAKTAAPELAIDLPLSTQTDAPSLALTIGVEASPDTVSVQLVINGEPQPLIDIEAPFTFEDAVFPEGTWSISAVGVNVWGNEATSESVTLQVGVEPAPFDGSSDGEPDEPDEPDETGGETGEEPDATGSDSGGFDEPDSSLPAGYGPSRGGPAETCACRSSSERGFGWLVLALVGIASARRRRRSRRSFARADLSRRV